MLRYLYTIVMYLLTPLIILRLVWKSRRLPDYRCRILERFGFSPIKPTDIWIHAVSLGEVVAATPLITALLNKQFKILVTTMTPTGSQQVIKQFGQKIAHQYIPYDLPIILRQFFKKARPSLGIIMETELWPNLIHEASSAHIPLILANGRISDKAFKKYQKVDFFFKPILAKFDSILTQSDLDTSRFLSLGASKTQTQTFGNIKFDLQIKCPNQEQLNQLKNAWGIKRPVFIAASTHDNEETQVLNMLHRLQNAIPNLLLLIAPRHPERFRTVYDLCLQQGFKTSLKSQSSTINTETEIVVLDSLGELLGFYQVSDYAFVGGSLVPIGGHNVLEPIAMNVPVFCGPFMNNSKSICADLTQANAIQQLANIDELVDAIIHMHQNNEQRIAQITNATKILVANQGCVDRLLKKMMTFFPNRAYEHSR